MVQRLRNAGNLFENAEAGSPGASQRIFWPGRGAGGDVGSYYVIQAGFEP